MTAHETHPQYTSFIRRLSGRTIVSKTVHLVAGNRTACGKPLTDRWFILDDQNQPDLAMNCRKCRQLTKE